MSRISKNHLQEKTIFVKSYLIKHRKVKQEQCRYLRPKCVCSLFFFHKKYLKVEIIKLKCRKIRLLFIYCYFKLEFVLLTVSLMDFLVLFLSCFLRFFRYKILGDWNENESIFFLRFNFNFCFCTLLPLCYGLSWVSEDTRTAIAAATGKKQEP